MKNMKTRDEISNEEAMRNPIFLLQSRHIIVTNIDKYDYNSDAEAIMDDKGNILSNQDLLDRADAIEVWITESVWLTREEAEHYGQQKFYRYPDGWQVYCVNAEGELAKFGI
jgi:hypothetical protein